MLVCSVQGGCTPVTERALLDVERHAPVDIASDMQRLPRGSAEDAQRASESRAVAGCTAGSRYGFAGCLREEGGLSSPPPTSSRGYTITATLSGVATFKEQILTTGFCHVCVLAHRLHASPRQIECMPMIDPPLYASSATIVPAQCCVRGHTLKSPCPETAAGTRSSVHLAAPSPASLDLPQFLHQSEGRASTYGGGARRTPCSPSCVGKGRRSARGTGGARWRRSTGARCLAWQIPNVAELRMLVPSHILQGGGSDDVFDMVMLRFLVPSGVPLEQQRVGSGSRAGDSSEA
ncbi:hypothetical protein FB451DRAFT_1552358 [Mycena latifolia]|nr:hypothetical protein FB451DRAFT_1552358 [Mycena latifolia]